MAKVQKSITMDEEIAKSAEKQALEERRSFSGLIEYLVSTYLKRVKNNKLN